MIEDSSVTDRFQLIVKPGQQRQVTISFTNFGSAPVQLTASPRNASTSDQGKLIYSNVVHAGDNKLQFAFTEMTKPKTIHLDAQETKDVSFTINVPKSPFIGLIMGGFYIYDPTQGPQAGSVAVPVWLTQTNKAVGGTLLLTGIHAKAVNEQPYMYVNLSNTQPGIMKNVVVHMKIRRNGFMEWLNLGLKPMTADLRYDTVAPNSAVPIAFNQKQTPIKAGNYVVDGTATAGKAKWKFGGTYSISKEQADRVNKASKNLIYDYTWAYLLGIVGLVVLIIIVLLLIHHQLKYRPRHLRKRGEGKKAVFVRKSKSNR
ncbi:hypothetical protein L248_2248 [Schleiferilactobacillus shenzhenensis LY-73]|uniref:Uncharacterized protein n=2 Tax=Schleiferilactobacillus shenzhenensis TaxID=1231337 RepID=U4TP83_9LACO|nr:hypothetical protein L248_2248 [Schleiferilactobacillus shenzhenensis LY-73]